MESLWPGFGSDAYSSVTCGEIGSVDPFKDAFFSRQVEENTSIK